MTTDPASAAPSPRSVREQLPVWLDALPLSAAARPARTGCPVCAHWVRVGYSGGAAVVAQHNRPLTGVQALSGHEHAGCCRCPGSYTPVADGDAVEHTRARPLGRPVTGVLPAVVITQIPTPRLPAPAEQAPQRQEAP